MATAAAPVKTAQQDVKDAAEALSAAHQACIAHKPGAEAAEEEATLRLEAAVAASKAVSPWVTWSPEQIVAHINYLKKVEDELPATMAKIEAQAAAMAAAGIVAAESVPRI